MKINSRILVLLIIPLMLAGTALAGKPKGRKLPLGSYIKSAKIKILKGDSTGYAEARYMLDSLFLHYGPHAEALYLMGQMAVDGIETAPNIAAKGEFSRILVAYADSLHMCCDNKEVKKKYRKGCKKYTSLMDSIKVKYWRQFYHAGAEHLKEIETLKEEQETETDSSALAFISKSIAASTDTCAANLQVAMSIDPTDYQSYVAMGTAYELQDDFATAIEWLEKGLELTSDRATMLLTIAYDYIQIEDYCGAVPYFAEHAQDDPGDLANKNNLAICLNNCEMYDSAVTVYRGILESDENNTSALTSIGRYHNHQARLASDSARRYQDEENDAQMKAWRQNRQSCFDSAKVHFLKAFDLLPEDEFIAGELGRASYVLGDFKTSAMAFDRLTQLVPADLENWTTLGDCYLQLKEFEKAAVAYEKVIEGSPEDREILERLQFLYKQIGKSVDLARVEKMLSSLE